MLQSIAEKSLLICVCVHVRIKCIDTGWTGKCIEQLTTGQWQMQAKDLLLFTCKLERSCVEYLLFIYNAAHKLQHTSLAVATTPDYRNIHSFLLTSNYWFPCVRIVLWAHLCVMEFSIIILVMADFEQSLSKIKLWVWLAIYPALFNRHQRPWKWWY